MIIYKQEKSAESAYAFGASLPEALQLTQNFVSR